MNVTGIATPLVQTNAANNFKERQTKLKTDLLEFLLFFWLPMPVSTVV